MGEADEPFQTVGLIETGTVRFDQPRATAPECALNSNGRKESMTDLMRVLQDPPAHPYDPLDASKILAYSAACRALWDWDDPIGLPELIEALKDPNYVCVCATVALARIRHPNAIGPLVAVLEDEKKFWVPRGAAAVALGKFGEMARAALPALRKALDYDFASSGESWDLRAREAVEDAITHITDPSAPCALKGRGYRFEMWGIY